jgi:hypothetical protein
MFGNINMQNLDINYQTYLLLFFQISGGFLCLAQPWYNGYMHRKLLQWGKPTKVIFYYQNILSVWLLLYLMLSKLDNFQISSY